MKKLFFIILSSCLCNLMYAETYNSEFSSPRPLGAIIVEKGTMHTFRITGINNDYEVDWYVNNVLVKKDDKKGLTNPKIKNISININTVVKAKIRNAIDNKHLETHIWHILPRNFNQLKSSSSTTSDNVQIIGFSIPNETIKRGSTQQVKVKIRSTGESPRSFWIGLSFAHESTTLQNWPVGWYDIKPVHTNQLSKDEEQEVTFSFSIPSYLDPGQYYAVAKVWDQFDEDTQLFIGSDLANSNAWNTIELGAKSFTLGSFNSIPEGVAKQLLWGVENMLFETNIASSYQEHKKPLFCISADLDIDMSTIAGFPLSIGAGGAFLIDLADLFEYTPEGEDGWVTVYLDQNASVGLTVGLSEFKTSMGLTWFDFQNYNDRALADDRTEFQVSADVKLPFLTITDIGYNSNQELKPSIKFNGSSKIGVQINQKYDGLFCFEINKKNILKAIGEAFSNNRTVVETAEYFFNYFDNLSESNIGRRGTWDDGSWELTDGAYMTDLSLSEVYNNENNRKLYAHHFVVDVPLHSEELKVIVDGKNQIGNADLYVQYNHRPDMANNDIKRSENSNCDETIVIDNPSAGKWYVMIPSISEYSNVNVKAVLHTNMEPGLSNSAASPETGDENTKFKFSAHYYDPDGDEPLDGEMKLYLSGGIYETYSMTLESGTASNGVYSFTTKLPLGNYNYWIYFKNSANQEVFTEWLKGPSVYNSQNMTIIPRLICNEIEETNEIYLDYKVNDGESKSIQLKIGDNNEIAILPQGKINFSADTRGNFEHDKYQLRQDGETIREYTQYSPTIQFTEFAAGTYELRIYMDYTPQKFTVSGRIKNEDNSPYNEPVNITLSGYTDLATTSSNGEYSFNNVDGGVPIVIEAKGVPLGYSLNPEKRTLLNLRRDEDDLHFTVASDDSKVPTVQLSTMLDKESSVKNINFTWSGSDNVTSQENLLYQYRLEGYESVWSEWANTVSANYQLFNGSYKFVLYVKDEAENVSNTPLEYSFIVNANPRIESFEKSDNGIWATKVKIVNDGDPNPGDKVVLLKDYSLTNDKSILPVRLYRENTDIPCGAYDKIAKQLAVDAVFTRQNDCFIMTLPDDFSETNSLVYTIEWGKDIAFGWKDEVKVSPGFSTLTNNPPYDLDMESRYLDMNNNLWRLATYKKKINTDNTRYIYNSWAYINQANEQGILVGEKEIEYLPGSWESNIRYTKPECYVANIHYLNHKIFVSIKETKEERTFPDSETLDSDYQRYVVKELDSNGNAINSIEGDWNEGYSYDLPKSQVNNQLWITSSNVTDTHRRLMFTIINTNGVKVKDHVEFEKVEKAQDIDEAEIYSIGNNKVLLIYEHSWDTAERDDRKNLCFQIRDNSGNLLKGKTIINPPLLDDSIEDYDEYELESAISDNLGRVWISYEHTRSGMDKKYYYVVLDGSGSIIHGPIETITDRDFIICDKDNYVWSEENQTLFLNNTVFDELRFPKLNVIVPDQKLGNNLADVSYTGYRIFDRWSDINFVVNKDESVNIEKAQLFHVPINSGVSLKDVSLKINDNQEVHELGDFPSFIELNASGVVKTGINEFSFSQNSLLGGNLILTFPLVITPYTVTFNNWDGTELKTEIVIHGNSATAPDNPTREGHKFSSWDIEFGNITNNTTVTAEYEINTYTVTFKGWDGTELKTETVEHGNSTTAPDAPTRDGYTFIAWDTEFESITNHTTVTAEYDINTYTVTFKNWDGTELKTETVEHGNSAIAPDDPTRDGYTFAGWKTEFESITNHTTVTAEYDINTYTVTFKNWDGTELKTETVEHGNNATAPDDPTRDGYTFTGWNTEFASIKNNTTITAEYVINTYTVTFKNWDGTVLKTETVEHGNSATAPDDPTRDGYTFKNWDKTFDIITSDLTVTAQFKIIPYTVTFKNWDGTELKTETVEHGNSATAPDDPTRYAYIFTTWDIEFANITDNIIVTAQFKPNTPPDKPVITAPLENQEVQIPSSSQEFTINWTCSDPDEDDLNYTVCISRTEVGLATAEKNNTDNTSISLNFKNVDFDYRGVWYAHVLAMDGIETVASDVVKFELDWVTSAEDLKFEEQITIYPNPTHQFLNIEFTHEPNKYNYELYNNLGQKVLQKETSNRLEQIDLTNTVSGIYYLKIYNKEFSKTEKIIVR